MKKKLFLLAVLLTAAVLAACAGRPAAAASPSAGGAGPQIVELHLGEIGDNAGIKDPIVPAYLPGGANELHKQMDKAEILRDGEVLVSIEYAEIKDGNAYPEHGKAAVTESDGGITLALRLNSGVACTLKSSKVPKDELVRVAESFHLEEGPKAEPPKDQ
jgi:hypothetical protein